MAINETVTDKHVAALRYMVTLQRLGLLVNLSGDTFNWFLDAAELIVGREWPEDWLLEGCSMADCAVTGEPLDDEHPRKGSGVEVPP